MSVRRLHYLACDVCGDPCGGDEGMCDTPAEARRFAYRRGWKRVEGKDMCRACRACHVKRPE